MSQRRDWPGLAEDGLVAVARAFAAGVREGGVVFLDGELGAGKTTFVRALLVASGALGRVRSPTYSLIESYPIDGRAAHHLDLYRIGDPGELEWLGLSDLAAADDLVLVEWPERGVSALPAADLRVALAHAGDLRDLRVEALTARGQRWLARVPVEPDS
jgi:tRNA threonylcarbamoyladenosine biosynthesis protein TsaE